MRLQEVSKVTGVSRSTLYRWAKQGRFPKPIKLGERCSGWLSSEIDDFVNTKMLARK